MALINGIGAGIYSEFSYKELTDDIGAAHQMLAAQTTTAAAQTDYEETTDRDITYRGSTVTTAGLEAEVGTLNTVNNIREFPSFGAPANIVNVPVYGSAVSSQIGGQSDAPTLEFTLNYDPSLHDDLHDVVQDGNEYIFKLNLKNDTSTNNAAFFVIGKFEALSVSPNLTDSNQATLTLSTTSGYAGPVYD